MIPFTVFLVLHCLQVTRTTKIFFFLFIACVWLVQRGEEETEMLSKHIELRQALAADQTLETPGWVGSVACKFDAVKLRGEPSSWSSFDDPRQSRFMPALRP